MAGMTGVGITRNLRDGVWKYSDAGSAVLTLAIDEGDFTTSESLETVNVMDRGALSHVRAGDEVPVTWSLTAKFTQWYGTGAALETLVELAHQVAGVSLSSTAATGEPFMFTQALEVVDPGDTAWVESYSLTRCRMEKCDFKEGAEYNTIAMNGTAYVTKGTVSSSSSSLG